MKILQLLIITLILFSGCDKDDPEPESHHGCLIAELNFSSTVIEVDHLDKDRIHHIRHDISDDERLTYTFSHDQNNHVSEVVFTKNGESVGRDIEVEYDGINLSRVRDDHNDKIKEFKIFYENGKVSKVEEWVIEQVEPEIRGLYSTTELKYSEGTVEVKVNKSFITNASETYTMDNGENPLARAEFFINFLLDRETSFPIYMNYLTFFHENNIIHSLIYNGDEISLPYITEYTPEGLPEKQQIGSLELSYTYQYCGASLSPNRRLLGE